jgi:hypothetical protein
MVQYWQLALDLGKEWEKARGATKEEGFPTFGICDQHTEKSVGIK